MSMGKLGFVLEIIFGYHQEMIQKEHHFEKNKDEKTMMENNKKYGKP